MMSRRCIAVTSAQGVRPISEIQANPYEAPEPTDLADGAGMTRWSTQTICLAAMYAVSAGWGASQIVDFDNGTIYTVCSLFLAFAATSWAVADARNREVRFAGILRVLYFLFWPFASFIYLTATRRFRGAGWWLLNVVGIYGVMAVAFYAFYYLLFSIGRQDLIDPIFY